MGKPETIDAYLEAVGSHISWKQARKPVLDELRQHMEDQRDALGEGEDAERLSVLEMGDPDTVGEELNRVHRPRRQLLPLLLVFALGSAGGLLRLVCGACFLAPERVLLSLLLGFGALVGMYFSDVSGWVCHGGAIFAGGLLLSGIALLTSPQINGVSYYTQYIVLTYPVLYALWLLRFQRRGWAGLVLSAAGGFALLWIAALANYLSGMLLLLATELLLTAAAAWRDWFGIGRTRGVLLSLTGAAVLPAVCSGILTWRISAALHPEADPHGIGYQAMTVRAALSSSRWWGRGSGTNAPVPDAEQEFLLTSLSCRFGRSALLVLLCAMCVFLAVLLLRTLRCSSFPGTLLALSVTVPLGLQALLSTAMNLGYVLFSVHFPLVVGNLHTVLDMALIGFVLAILRSGSLLRESGRRPGKWPTGPYPFRVLGRTVTVSERRA